MVASEDAANKVVDVIVRTMERASSGLDRKPATPQVLLPGIKEALGNIVWKESKTKFFSDWLRQECSSFTLLAAGLPDSQGDTKRFMAKRCQAWLDEAESWDKLFRDEN